MHPHFRDLDNEPDEAKYRKMGEAISLLRDIAKDGPATTCFIRRGTQLDLYAISHAFIYSMVVEALVHAEHDPKERDYVNSADLNAWHQALIDATRIISCLPAFGIGARQNHDWVRFTKGGFRAHQMAWRMLNAIAHRTPGTVWPSPQEAMAIAVKDYMQMAMKYGRTYADIDDYTGEKWYPESKQQYALWYRIDPALHGRLGDGADSAMVEMVDPGFVSYLEYVFAVEDEPFARAELIKDTWDPNSQNLAIQVSLPGNEIVEY